jgi:hypothetical protein
MNTDALVIAVAIAVIAIVFTSRAGKTRATTSSRTQVLQAAAPILGGSLVSGVLKGTYQGHLIEASLRTTGRIDSIGGSHSSGSHIEVLLLEIHGGSPRRSS